MDNQDQCIPFPNDIAGYGLSIRTTGKGFVEGWASGPLGGLYCQGGIETSTGL